jgi:hypothetical protein
MQKRKKHRLYQHKQICSSTNGAPVSLIKAIGIIKKSLGKKHTRFNINEIFVLKFFKVSYKKANSSFTKESNYDSLMRHFKRENKI